MKSSPITGYMVLTASTYSQTKAVQYDDICQFMHYCSWSNNDRRFDDVFELCGGTAKVSVLLIRRRHYKVGPNFDAVVGIDLTKPQQVQELW
eukprot:3612568-Prorocentrum_lima.AAC.1